MLLLKILVTALLGEITNMIIQIFYHLVGTNFGSFNNFVLISVRLWILRLDTHVSLCKLNLNINHITWLSIGINLGRDQYLTQNHSF